MKKFKKHKNEDYKHYYYYSNQYSLTYKLKVNCHFFFIKRSYLYLHPVSANGNKAVIFSRSRYSLSCLNPAF